MTSRLRRVAMPVGVVAVAMTSCIGMCVGFPCFPLGIRYGLWADTCPATDVRLGADVNARSLRRGDDSGRVEVLPRAQWLEGRGRNAYTTEGLLRRGFSTDLTLWKGDTQVEGFRATSGDATGRFEVALPDLPDGDYVLKASIDAGFDTTEVKVPLAMYAPAHVHVASDRPLYKPGQTVQLRSAVLRRDDGAPLDERPGRWTVQAPDGEAMLVEDAAGGPWGVAATTFPLSDDAMQGTWSAEYRSGDDHDRIAFDVRPFQLPRMRVEAKGVERWFGIADEVVLEGRVVYASGAPVGDAALAARVRVTEGRWPMPLAWEAPIQGRTAADGTFRIEVGEVPADLLDRTRLAVQITAVDAAGESVAGGASVVLSVDDVQLEAVTELPGGLVQGFNNRAYVRATTPDGVPLAGADLRFTRPYDPAAPAFEATTDEDGVAALQIDPGPAVTVVDPAPPVRPRPLTPEVPQLVDARNLGEQRALDLAERRAFDGIVDAVAGCGHLVIGGSTVPLAVTVSPSGAVRADAAGTDPLTRCVVDAHRGLRLGAGPERTYRVVWRATDGLQPSLRWSHDEALSGGSEVTQALEQAGLRARACAARGEGVDGAPVVAVHWSVDGRGQVSPRVVNEGGTGLSQRAVGCLQRELQGVRSVERPEGRGVAVGVSHARLSVPQPPGSRRPQALTRTGYELAVAATVEGDAAGSSRLVLGEGAIPPLRLRATPSLATPGTEVELALFRGPAFRGRLPEKLYVRQHGRTVATVAMDDPRGTFTVPDGVQGFVEVQHDGARAVLFVAPAAPLAVDLATDRPSYRPGEEAQLTVTTRAGAQGRPSAVLLAGVDQSLGQLAPLLGPDDWGRVTVTAQSPQPAFETFDAKALSLGRVRGANAAQAAVLRVTQLADADAGTSAVGGHGAAAPEVEAALSEAFYRALEATLARVRAWEASAPAGETMQPEVMVRLWNEALAALAREGTPAIDAYGRSLTLDLLPDELLVQVDPRVMVADGTRLPEDIVSWTAHVATEVR